MPGSVQNRCVTPIIDLLKAICRGRASKTNSLRFANEMAARTQLQPNLPGGPYNKTTGISYYMRDARREVKPPPIIAEEHHVLLRKQSEHSRHLTPGKVYEPL